MEGLLTCEFSSLVACHLIGLSGNGNAWKVVMACISIYWLLARPL